MRESFLSQDSLIVNPVSATVCTRASQASLLLLSCTTSSSRTTSGLFPESSVPVTCWFAFGLFCHWILKKDERRRLQGARYGEKGKHRALFVWVWQRNLAFCHCADFFLLICSLLRYLRPLFCGDGKVLCPVVKLKKRGSSWSGALPLPVEGKGMSAWTNKLPWRG